MSGVWLQDHRTEDYHIAIVLSDDGEWHVLMVDIKRPKQLPVHHVARTTGYARSATLLSQSLPRRVGRSPSNGLNSYIQRHRAEHDDLPAPFTFPANMTTLLEWLNNFINFQTQHKILTNFLLTLTIGFWPVAIRRYLLSVVPDGINITERRRKVVSIRNSVAGLAIFLIVLVWSTELKTFMVSLLAITAAIVLATKKSSWPPSAV